MFTYLPDGKTPKMNERGEPFGEGGRQSGKPSKIARKILTPVVLERLLDTDFELFATNIKADTEKVGKIQLVSGEDIRYWYHEDNYEPPKWYSCSSDQSQQDC